MDLHKMKNAHEICYCMHLICLYPICSVAFISFDTKPLTIFSRRLSRETSFSENSCLVLFVFFWYTWSDQIVLPWYFYKILGRRQIVPVCQRNWIKKVSRVTYSTGRDQKNPSCSFFGIARLFRGKGFLEFCDRMDVEKSQMVSPFSCFGIVRLFP